MGVIIPLSGFSSTKNTYLYKDIYYSLYNLQKIENNLLIGQKQLTNPWNIRGIKYEAAIKRTKYLYKE